MTTKTFQVLRYDDTELDEDSLRKVREELKETDEGRKRCLDKLKKKLLERTDINPCLDENFLLAYLRVSKFDCTKAYQRILQYYSERYNLQEVFEDFSPSSVKIVECARQFYVCPYRSKDNSAILILTRKDYDQSKVSYDLIIRAVFMVIDSITQHPLNQMCGYTAIMDLKSSSWSGWSDYTPTRLKLIARLAQKSLAVRIRSVHIINAPSVYFLLYSIIYPFLSVKIRSRIFLHKNLESLHKHVNPENISKEYGGYLEHSELINLLERVYEKEDFFQKYSKYGFIKKIK